jgi:hypothetical protein
VLLVCTVDTAENEKIKAFPHISTDILPQKKTLHNRPFAYAIFGTHI